MSKAAVIFWSQTGNTEQMANAIADGIREGGMEVDVLNVADTTPADAVKYAKIALGCPAMGAEVLEETEFDPFFTELESKISGLKVALFGSYGWGDGQWMRDWVQRTNDANAVIYTDEQYLSEEPDASYTGNVGPFYPQSVTWKFKRPQDGNADTSEGEKLISLPKLTESERSILLDNHVNFLTEEYKRQYVKDGTCLDGEFIGSPSGCATCSTICCLKTPTSTMAMTGLALSLLRSFRLLPRRLT